MALESKLRLQYLASFKVDAASGFATIRPLPIPLVRSTSCYIKSISESCIKAKDICLSDRERTRELRDNITSPRATPNKIAISTIANANRQPGCVRDFIKREVVSSDAAVENAFNQQTASNTDSYNLQATMSEEQRINACKTAINQIYTMLRSSPQQWRNFLGLARTTIAHLESTTFMQQPAKTGEQAWMLAALQMLACKDVDSGVVTDIAAWCSRQWLAIVQREPQNLAALRGLGQMWLSRAQPSLARIHTAQGSSSSQRSARTSSGGRESAAEAERRVGTADYVEARGFLQPATEYFERAVAAALTQDALSGELVAKAAEAYMSLGNVSSPRANEKHFQRALQLLQRASQVEGYNLPGHLQRYLEEFGRLYQ